MESIKGWVIRSETTFPGATRSQVGWWQGQHHGWGRIYGPPADAKVFISKTAAEMAYRKISGDLGTTAKAQRLLSAFAEYETA